MMRPKQMVMITLPLILSSIFLFVYVKMGKENVTELSAGQLKSLQSATVTSSKKNSNVIIDTESENKNIGQSDEQAIIDVAMKISKRSNGTVLVTMVNDAYLSFTYSWLCNTKEMDVHKSVLIITTDKESKEKLVRDWPEIEVVGMDIATKGDQVYSHVGYVRIMVKRTEMLLAIVQSNVEMFVFEVDCLWFTNPLPNLKAMVGADILVNPVAQRRDVYAGGFLYLFPTEKGKNLWKKLTEMMTNLGERISKLADNAKVSEGDNDQQYLSQLITKRYGGITVKKLPLETYADGKWYEMPEAKRNASHPLIVNNNWVLGNKAKIDRAKKWKHWFIKEDMTCDMDLVRKTVYS